MFGWKKKDAEGSPSSLKTEIKDLKVTLKEKKACIATLEVEVPANHVEAAIEKSFAKIQTKAKIPGFRPGKAPLDIIRKSYAQGAREQAINDVLKESVFKALQKEKIEAVAAPSIEKLNVDTKKPLQFEVKVECAPIVDVKGYKDLKLQKKKINVTEDIINKRIDEIRESNSKLVPSKDETVEEKHFVTVDYEGVADGKILPGSRAENQLIEMKAAQTIKGFTEGLKGAKVGETKDIEVSYPKDHPNKDLALKLVTFKVTVKEIKEKKAPVVDDEFAKDVGCQNLVDLKEKVKKNLESEQERQIRQDLENQTISGLLEKNNFDVPPTLVNERRQYLNQRLKDYLMQQGATEDEWKKNEEKMTSKNTPEAEKQVRLSYILSYIADVEKLEITEEEIVKYEKESLERVEPSRRQEMEQWMKGRQDQFKGQLKEQKLFDFLIKNSQVTEVLSQ